MKTLAQLKADERIEKLEAESGSYFVKLADGWLMEGLPKQNAFLAHSVKDLNRLIKYAVDVRDWPTFKIIGWDSTLSEWYEREIAARDIEQARQRCRSNECIE